MKTVFGIIILVTTFTLEGCSQNENKYFTEVAKLVTLINNEDTLGIQSLIVGRLANTKFLKANLWNDIKKFNQYIDRFGPPQKFTLKQYPQNDIRLCDVLVKVGDDVDYSILTAYFYRDFKPEKIFLFEIAFDTNSKGKIYAPENK